MTLPPTRSNFRPRRGQLCRKGSGFRETRDWNLVKSSQAEVATHIADDHSIVENGIPITQDENDPYHQVFPALEQAVICARVLNSRL